MPVRGDADRPQVPNGLHGESAGEQSGVSKRTSIEEAEQVVGGGSVAVDRVDRRPPNLVAVLEPPLAECGDRQRLEAEGGRGAGFELVVDPGGELPCGVAVGSDAGPFPLAVFEIAEVPDAAAEVAGHLADAERVGAGHVILREPSRHKVPQKVPQTGCSETSQKGKRPVRQAFLPHGPAGQRRGRDSNPR